jgi:hypothetical protein
MTTRLALVLALAASALLSSGCAARRIGETQIRDTPENRAVYEVVRTYEQALENRDAATLLALAAPDYYDTAGTQDPADDLDRARLERTLAEDLARLEGVRLDVVVRGVGVEGDAAWAEIFYDDYYRVQTASGAAVPRRDSDIHRIQLRRVDGAWKITSGL